jgi:hypothetical protein
LSRQLCSGLSLGCFFSLSVSCFNGSSPRVYEPDLFFLSVGQCFSLDEPIGPDVIKKDAAE